MKLVHKTAEIPNDELKAIIGHIRIALDKPDNPAAIVLGKSSLETLDGYLPETVEGAMPHSKAEVRATWLFTSPKYPGWTGHFGVYGSREDVDTLRRDLEERDFRIAESYEDQYYFFYQSVSQLYDEFPPAMDE